MKNHTCFLGEREGTFRQYRSEKLTVTTFLRDPANTLYAMEHSHPEYEFLIPLTPIPFLMCEGVAYFGEVGQVFPVSSGIMHGIKYDVADVSYDSVAFQKSYFENALREKKKEDIAFCSALPLSGELKLYISAFKKETEKKDPTDKSKLENLTALICAEMIDLASVELPNERRVSVNYQRGLRCAAEFMNDNYEKPITVIEVAAVCGLSVNYFSTCFKKMFGDTPFCYLRRLRVSKAKVLLETTDRTISEISARCGFRLASTFTEAFRTVTGKTPGEYKSAQN